MERRILFAICCWLLSVTQAHAFLREIDPKSTPKLGPDEGLLLASVDSLAPLNYVRVQREGNIFSYAKLADIKAGVTTKLYAAPAGKYRWDRVSLNQDYYYELSDDAELKFEIKPGVVNYPGDLLIRRGTGTRGRMHPRDRALHAMDWLEGTFPSLMSMPFEYVGRYPDPFVAYYRKARQAHPEKPFADLDTTLAPAAAGKLALPVEELWQPGKITSLALNPGGDLLAEAIYEHGRWGIDLFDLKASDVKRLVNPPFAVDNLRWLGNRALVASLGERGEKNFVAIFQIDDGGPKGRTIKNINLPYLAEIVGDIPSDPSQLIVSSSSPHGQEMVHRVDISSEASIKHSRHDVESRLNKGLDDDFAWYADSVGSIRAALAKVGKQVGLFYGANGEYQELIRFEADQEPTFFPYRLSAQGNLIYGLSESGRDQRDFVVFDPLARSITQTLFSKPGLDVEGPIFSRAGEPIGAKYYDAGHLVSAYFDDSDRHLNALIEKAFPDKTAVVMARDDVGKIAILGVDGSDSPFAVYELNAENHRASLIDQTTPALSKRQWVPSVVIRTRGVDGLPIEAYLSVPSASSKLPLVLLAHGGPIGIRDARHFDPEVQFLTSLGYAVLQVNFRGSEGYGRAYREAGKGSYGTLIEDDIDSALEAALAKYPLDRNRMCAMGTSYGGYSALMSAIRHPDRFRCVVSVAGPSDRALSFTASDAAYGATGRKALESYIGDPRAHPENISHISPVYRVEDLKAPLFLIHGTEDERVDYENTRRLVRMLNLAGRPPTLLRLQGEGHGIVEMKNKATAYPAIAAFLKQYLPTDAATAVSSQ